MRVGLVCVALVLAGCSGYRVGVPSLYRTDIATVYVPMFESTSYRRNFGERLTEAVVKEIEARTPYKVVSSPNADSVLTGEIYETTKYPSVETGTDEPRELTLRVAARVRWVDRKGDLIRQSAVPLPPELDTFALARPTPETGQSIATGYQRVIDRLAAQIVDLMEPPWGEAAPPEFLAP